MLLAALVAARGAPVSTERLAEAVWPEAPPQDPQANLATLASRLRRVVGDDVVVPGPASYALGGRIELDLEIAADLVAVAASRLTRGEPTLAVASATRALDLLGDGRLAEEFGEWADTFRREAVEGCREARHVLARSATAIGRADLALAAANVACSDDPFDERAHRDVMRALVVDGRPSAALDTYQVLASRLADELGADPDQETRRLQLSILRGEPVEAIEPAPPTTTSSALVGREQELAVLDAAWVDASAGRTSLVLVDGVPGIGKTRLLAEATALADRSGGLVLSTVCRPGERSLFLQPFVDVLRPVLLGDAPGRARRAARLPPGHVGAPAARARRGAGDPVRAGRVRRPGAPPVLRRRRRGARRPVGRSPGAARARRPPVRRRRHRGPARPPAGPARVGTRAPPRGHPERGSAGSRPGDRPSAPGAPGAAAGVRGGVARGGRRLRVPRRAGAGAHPRPRAERRGQPPGARVGKLRHPAGRRGGRRRPAGPARPGDRRDRPRSRRPRAPGSTPRSSVGWSSARRWPSASPAPS